MAQGIRKSMLLLLAGFLVAWAAGCNNSGGSNGNPTGTPVTEDALIWDQGNWDEKNWN